VSIADLSERDWQQQIIDLAHMFGWLVAHFRAAKTAKGWRTAVAADGAGWPDLCMVRDRVLWIENKREKGKLDQNQIDWIRWLDRAGAEVYVARPRHLDELAHILSKRQRPTLTEIPLLAAELDTIRSSG